MYLPARQLLTPIDSDDPLPYYFSPIMGAIYRARLAAALELLEAQSAGACIEASKAGRRAAL